MVTWCELSKISCCDVCLQLSSHIGSRKAHTYARNATFMAGATANFSTEAIPAQQNRMKTSEELGNTVELPVGGAMSTSMNRRWTEFIRSIGGSNQDGRNGAYVFGQLVQGDNPGGHPT